MSTEKRTYQVNASVTMACLNALQNYLMQDNFRCQQAPTEDGGMLLQIEKKGGWRKVTGNSTALNIIFHQESENKMSVEIGAGRWMDKAGAGAAGMLIFAPLAVTAVVGAVKQSKMSGKIFQYIENYLASAKANSPLLNDTPTFSSSSPSNSVSTNSKASDNMKAKPEIDALDSIINEPSKG